MFNQSLFDYLKLAVIEVFTSCTLVNIKNRICGDFNFFFSFSESWYINIKLYMPLHTLNSVCLNSFEINM